MTISERIAITGATGQLGRLVIAELLRIAPAAHLIGIVRNASAAKDLAERGVELRTANYDDPDAIKAALAGADKVLLISSSEIGQRVRQHGNVIDAAKAAAVKLLAYTSILHADTSPLALAEEHRGTEALIRASGVPFVLLRNGWYTENYTGNVAAAIQHGAVLGAAGHGRISLAARADYAAAAAAVLASRETQAGRICELAGDNGYTLADYAAEISRQSGKPIVYKDLPEAEYKAALESIGLPEAFAALLADSDANAAKGALYDDSRQLSGLIGHPTTPMAHSVAAALAR
ncbi:NmrA family NAD(P)-binding protein [Bradyrhizobium sp. BRP22]|uniref:NmrA family NAD(P)-binding protein n=2 Tax=unclassified Bradyrhizobium TaxID=2631580 RepID=UPI001CD51B9C|nr:NmrA family NAD(P)-binding protein [Bradyrhizobium sp. BRP22]